MVEDQIKGAVRNVAGHVQDAVGGLTGDRSTQAKGMGNEAGGAVQYGFGKAVDAVQDKYGEFESFLRNQPVAAIGFGFMLGFIAKSLLSFNDR